MRSFLVLTYAVACFGVSACVANSGEQAAASGGAARAPAGEPKKANSAAALGATTAALDQYAVVLYEHERYNHGPVAADTTGIVVAIRDAGGLNELEHVQDIYGNFVDFNDKLSSFHIKDGYQVEFFRDSNFLGKPLITAPSYQSRHDVANLALFGVGYNDEISSLRVRKTHSMQTADNQSVITMITQWLD
ncbi:hypothetical protein [Hymenobacter sp. BT491]|uniref:hypothetical protein n=1 Tax=Hymenobacter sp. BT491 TaxID=2766779 RepID=UPI00165386CA|nr:hypothetical protein [Hymenobacter sp. BT491]MBC6992380.1 hypothetical protein [Hymenobacter sp. BT491]